MNSISAALEQMQQELAGEFADEPGLRCLCVAVTISDSSDPLAWLTAQPVFPHFYWQQRSGSEEAAALGALLRFSSLEKAQRFIQTYPEQPHLRVWGLNAFDPTHGFLFFSRLEWRRAGNQAYLWLHLYSETSLKQDALAAVSFIDRLLPAKPFPRLVLHCCNETHLPGQPEWHRLISLATGAIARGELDKVVLARATDLAFTSPVSAGGFMAASRRVNLNCYHFFMAFDSQKTFLGSSPERLWRRIDDALRTEALAGTVANHPDDQQAAALGAWLLKDDKNQRENMLVVEDICQRLQKMPGSLDVLPSQIVRLRKVQHLRRCIWARLERQDDLHCLQQLQPTAAVAGLPREPARAFIAAHELFEREWYAGSAGYLSGHQTEFCVALRSAMVSGTVVRLYAGAGIVAGSVAEDEWQEIENKAAGLKTLLFGGES